MKFTCGLRKKKLCTYSRINNFKKNYKLKIRKFYYWWLKIEKEKLWRNKKVESRKIGSWQFKNEKTKKKLKIKNRSNFLYLNQKLKKIPEIREKKTKIAEVFCENLLTGNHVMSIWIDLIDYIHKSFFRLIQDEFSLLKVIFIYQKENYWLFLCDVSDGKFISKDVTNCGVFKKRSKPS